MRVMILTNNDGGLISFRRELLEELIQLGHEVLCCAPTGQSVPVIQAIGCAFIPLEMNRHGTNPFQEIKLITFYKKLIRENKPDIVFTYTIKCNAYGGMACARLGVPYVANITGLGTSIENGGMMQKISLLLYKAGLRKAKKVFFQNTENRDFMVNQGIVKGNYDLLPGSGVNLERYKVFPYPDEESVDFIFVARVMKEKGIDNYLDAAKVIKKRHPETKFHVCGFCEQDYEETLKRLNDDGTIIYHGTVADMRPIYKMASCTVHPTYYPEGMSNVLLESCACGRPIITTDRAGCREIVENGVNGFLIKSKDSHDLIDKIETFLSCSWEQRRDMGLAGREKVAREFSRQIVVDRYLAELPKED